MQTRVLLALLVLSGGTAIAAELDGATSFQKCHACHSVAPGETNLPGPNLCGIVGRRVASEAGFDYSPAFQALAARGNVRWSEATLDRFLTDPEGAVPGTWMSFPGLADKAERRAVIGFLQDCTAQP